MTSSVVSTESILAIDIGTISTRAALFDVVGERYRFIASGKAQTTIIPPFNDVRLGLIRAIAQLQTTTGRALLGSDGTILIPSQPDGSGVDIMTATLSAGQEINVVAVGLLESISLESAQNLANQTYATVTETISMNDRRQQDARIDAILHTRPDLIIVAGGINDGASHSVNNLLEAVGLACYLMPRSQRPKILYAGNSSIREEVKDNITPITDLYIAPNIRPTIHNEQLIPAQQQLSEIFKNIRTEQIFGLSDLDKWAEGRIKPSATSFGRVIRFLSQIYASNKAVLGIDVGAGSTTVASALQGKLALNVYPQLGLGNKIDTLAQFMSVDQIAYWLPEDIPKPQIRDYLFNKAAHPASLPVTTEELAIEQAIARQIIRASVQQATANLPYETTSAGPEMLPWLEMVVASGSILNHAPSPGQSLLMLLDGLQPTGITTFMLDHNEIISSLGVAAEINPLLAVQVLESQALLNLGTVIAPVGRTRPGAPILRIRSTLNDGSQNNVDIKFGSIETIPVPSGQTAELHLQPLHRFDIGMGGPGRGGRVRVIGGELGIVIDARGRPLHINPDPAQRQTTIKRWITVLEQ
jgi:hypothetical protein